VFLSLVICIFDYLIIVKKSIKKCFKFFYFYFIKKKVTYEFWRLENFILKNIFFFPLTEFFFYIFLIVEFFWEPEKP